MIYTIDEIKKDLQQLSVEQFYTKYIVRSDNWYFEKILSIPLAEQDKLTDEYKLIISNGLNISINSITMVGSGKIGFSLSPSDKLFSPFNTDETVRKVSDLDIAIVSDSIFNKFWDLFRKGYRGHMDDWYKNFVFGEIYRGYINETIIENIDTCRKEWTRMIANVKKKLYEELYIKHEIHFRIYRSWEDFEEYNIQSIKRIQRELNDV